MPVVDRSDIGSFLYLVECKRYRADRPVGGGGVGHLFGVLQAAGATAGIVATTSYSTKDATSFQQQLEYQPSFATSPP